METEYVSEVSEPDMEAIEKQIVIYAYSYSYIIEEALTYNSNRCVSFVQFINTICCWFGVTGPYDIADIEKTASNLMTVPKSVSRISAWLWEGS